MTKPHDKITITVDDAEREIFMPFALVNELAKMVGSPDDVPQIFVNGELRDEVLKSVLAVRKKSGKIIDPVADLDDVELSIDDAEALLGWVAGHVMGFSVRSLQQVTDLSMKHQKDMDRLESSLGGSTN